MRLLLINKVDCMIVRSVLGQLVGTLIRKHISALANRARPRAKESPGIAFLMVVAKTQTHV